MILFFQIIFVLSILGIFFIIFRKIPALLEYPPESSEKSLIYQSIRKQWRKIKENTENSDFLHETVIPKTEKVLRRTKIILLKLDNFLAKRVDGLRQKMKKRGK